MAGVVDHLDVLEGLESLVCGGLGDSQLEFAGIGGVALLGAVVVASQRDVLLVIGAIGVFAAVVTLLLTPERYIATSTATDIYEAMAASWELLIDSLGMSGERYYLSVAEGEVRLFVPTDPLSQGPASQMPDIEDTRTPIVTPEIGPRGLVTTPTGASLLRAIPQPNVLLETTDPTTRIELACEAITDQFELADDVESTLDRGDGWLIVHTSGSTLGPLDRFDHPLPSLLGCACAVALGRPVQVRVDRSDDTADWIIRCSWSTE